MRSIACPKCKTKLAGSPDLLGVTVRCSKCGETFTASAANSPYIEGLPPLPTNRRPMLLAGAVLIGLVGMTGLILAINAMDETPNDTLVGGGGAQKEEPKPPRVNLPGNLKTADGIPIEIPDDDGPDRIPLPGDKLSPALEKAMALKEKEAAKAVKPGNALDDVVLAFVKWEYTEGHRSLKLGYAFANNQSPGAGVFTLKLKLNGDDKNVLSIPIEGGINAQGVMPFRPEKVAIGEGRPPKVDAWIERTAAGVGVKVSNVVSTE